MKVRGKLTRCVGNEKLEESYAEICALVNAGQLFTDDCYDEIAKNWNKQSVVKALCTHVAHDCNLRCKYCFASAINGSRV